jgi:hypothetical protein
VVPVRLFRAALNRLKHLPHRGCGHGSSAHADFALRRAARVLSFSFSISASSIIATFAEQSHQLNSGAPSATILNDVVAIRVWHAFLNLHCFFAYDTGQEINERAFIVV